MTFSDILREAGSMKLPVVDTIPADCGRKRRRLTNGTEETERCSDGDISEIVAIALSEDSESDSAEERLDQQSGTPCATPPGIEVEDMMDLSMEKLLRGRSFDSTSGRRLADLFEDNQRALQLLLAKEEALSKLKEETTEQCTSSTPIPSWTEAWQFEFQQSIPGVAAMLLYCVAHASTYELVSNLAYEAVEKAPNQDGTYSKPWGLYTAMLILGCLLARFSGMAWNFTSPMAYQRVKLIYHNRIRLGAKDARLLHWLQQQGEGLLGIVNLVSYYICYIAVVFFVGQLAMFCDQREDILGNLPSALYQEELASVTGSETATHLFPAQDHSSQAIFLQQNNTAGLEPLGYLKEREGLEIFGPEDDLYFFHALSKNSYEHFFGQEYETALFDSTHQILFYAALAATAIYTLKACVGFRFWAGW